MDYFVLEHNTSIYIDYSAIVNCVKWKSDIYIYIGSVQAFCRYEG